MPQKICMNCSNQIISASDTKRKVIDTEKLLRNQIKPENQIKVEHEIQEPELAIADFSLFHTEEFTFQCEFTNPILADCGETVDDAFSFEKNIRKALRRTRKPAKKQLTR